MKKPLSNPRDTEEWSRALEVLKRPLWPLIKLIQVLYLAGEYRDLKALFNDLPGEIELENGPYDNIQRRLNEYSDLIEGMLEPFYLDHDVPKVLLGDETLPPHEAYTAQLRQKLIERELEGVNSLLCSPMGCDLCCVGPRDDEKNLFFDIPLKMEEVDTIGITTFDTPLTRSSSPYDEQSLSIEKRPFYELGPVVITWRTGPSMILPRGERCPKLSRDVRCTIYPQRPWTCRRPPIFSYVLDRTGADGDFSLENKLLAIIECPIVQELKREIHLYASLNELDLVITRNRA